MKKIYILLLLTVAVGAAKAQKISRSYHEQSLSKVLEDLNVATTRHNISFVYNDLEDFTVTTAFEHLSLDDALTKVVGFYPVRIVRDGERYFVECTHKTELHLKGRLVDNQNSPMPYANISLLSPADSSLIGGGVSNENGDFVIPSEAYRAIVKCTYVGYKTLFRLCEVGDIGTLQLQPAEYTINGVTVEGTHIMNYIDKSVHTFSTEQIRQARNVRDLLEHVADLRIDPVSNKIKRIDGGSVKILLNGISASDIDLKGIPANKIAKVEYYNIPPARYADAGTLINVITKDMENGVNAGIEARTAFTTGFTDDEAYFNLTSGNHQLSLSYTFSLREYTKRYIEQEYNYLLDGYQTSYFRKLHDKFGYTWNDPVIKYTYNKPDNIAVQVVATPHFDTRHNDGSEDISIRSAANEIKGEGTMSSHTNTFGPEVNVYVQKILPNAQTLDIDLVGTYYHNKNENENQETDLSDGKSLLSDAVRQKNDKYSFIGELAYTKKWQTGSLSTGYRGEFGRSDATISNVLSGYQDYDYSSATYQHYLYAEYSGMLGRKLSYRIGAGATHVIQDNDDAHDTRWLFTETHSQHQPLEDNEPAVGHLVAPHHSHHLAAQQQRQPPHSPRDKHGQPQSEELQHLRDPTDTPLEPPMAEHPAVARLFLQRLTRQPLLHTAASQRTAVYRGNERKRQLLVQPRRLIQAHRQALQQRGADAHPAGLRLLPDRQQPHYRALPPHLGPRLLRPAVPQGQLGSRVSGQHRFEAAQGPRPRRRREPGVPASVLAEEGLAHLCRRLLAVHPLALFRLHAPHKHPAEPLQDVD